ncbi:GFA family protein [uncultured Thiothrix sp.]|uniref:GFA family protein n=1 Tax=uncultured Thiothrix sp. TaxID=223185 RepID=UPI00261856A0|nr:GFA family protein [uncultured Thiothrix sp.]
MQNESKLYQGGCLCGKIRYEATQFETNMAHCHCSMCRKFHGAAFASFGSVKQENFRWVQGEAELAAYQAPNGTVRRFCKHCGSSLTFASSVDAVAIIEITLGSLDSDLERLPDAHIYVGSKADWDVISDGLPQYEEGRASRLLTLP